MCNTALVTHTDSTLLLFHPKSSLWPQQVFGPFMLCESEPFSLSPRLFSVLWPGMKQCWPLNTALIPSHYQRQESHAPCGESKMDTSTTVSVALKTGLSAWFEQTAETTFVTTNPVSSLITSDSANMLYLARGQEVHTTHLSLATYLHIYLMLFHCDDYHLSTTHLTGL